MFRKLMLAEVVQNEPKYTLLILLYESSHRPRRHSRWEVKQTDTPEPGPNQVLIKIHASGMCYTDVHQTRGELPGDFPRTLGHEPVGEIVAVGSECGNARGRRPRRRAMGSAYVRPLRMVRPQQANLLRASHRHQRADRWRPRRIHARLRRRHHASAETLSYEQAAPIFCAGYTVWSGLRWAQPQPGERLAVVGVGGLGHLAIEYAKAAGFITIAISRSTDKDKMIRELGADEIVRDGKGLLQQEAPM